MRQWGKVLAAHPPVFAAASMLAFTLTIWFCAAHGWHLDEVVDLGRYRLRLWVVAAIGLPLWSVGIAVGVWQAVTGPRRRPASGRDHRQDGRAE